MFTAHPLPHTGSCALGRPRFLETRMGHWGDTIGTELCDIPYSRKSKMITEVLSPEYIELIVILQ